MLRFYAGKKILVTGHTGFKGTWLCKMLINAGAEVTGYALTPPTDPSLYTISKIDNHMCSIVGDIRDYDYLENIFNSKRPEIVIHLAAQPLVRDSYSSPRYTYETNVMGTVNILDCIRTNNFVRSFLNVTTDKVYQNNEWAWGYREIDPLDGYDPYSNSKSCSELVTHSYHKSFFQSGNVAISTARAGNVIGGGDFAKDRIIPDCVRAAENKTNIMVRNPNSVRPYQHVIEPLFAYLLIAQKQYENIKHADYYNVGPDETDCVTTGKLVDLFCNKWQNATGEKIERINLSSDGPHEASFLKLDCSKIKNTLNWKPRWHIEDAVEKTVEWANEYFYGDNISDLMNNQIRNYLIGG